MPLSVFIYLYKQAQMQLSSVQISYKHYTKEYNNKTKQEAWHLKPTQKTK
jgi:hypothetical protein